MMKVLLALFTGLPFAVGLPRSELEVRAEFVKDAHPAHQPREVIGNDTFDVLQHLSGNSPYFNSPGVGLTAALPVGCSVMHATYLVRHSDIYANDYEYEHTIAPFLYKLGNFSDRHAFSDDSSLSFLTNWTSPIDDPDKEIEKVTKTGKQDAAALGAIFAQRYNSILGFKNEDSWKFWSASATRDQKTSKAFIQGFNASMDKATLVIVDQGESQFANTLTPHQSCEAFDANRGSVEKMTFINTYAPTIAARLNGLVSSSFNWTASDVFAAQSLCGYDTVIRNMTLSGFCNLDLFSESEWLGYEYANDLMYHRSLGYGNELAPVLGMPWVSASTRLLSGSANTSATNSSAGDQQLFISFTHREEPPFIVTNLGLFNTTNASMPADSINYDRAWRTSNILPFLANIGLERLQCNATATGNSSNTDFVRVLVNAAQIPLPGCTDGPEDSCSLDSFVSFVSQREALYGDFVGACGGSGNVTNATSTLGFYEGTLPANGAAVQTAPISLNKSSSVSAQESG
ncbi:phosphoglycerate mutase-like protein [Fomitopsis serialis]|uniref:phosphoglycerate mutase-like protein n=1 Tax=Fomitopsis serialis TaxID=139415 RepID=UPI0020086F81|nr:phosphoglycerate mutase-like protein [Neoantrodia serialis]KAH9922704.1 phosphoglycerate mutase-like protein [Neoantrodia serialis]